MCQTVTVFVIEDTALNKTFSQPYWSLEPKGKDGHWISNCNQVECYEEAYNTGSSPTSPTSKSLVPILHLQLINKHFQSKSNIFKTKLIPSKSTPFPTLFFEWYHHSLRHGVQHQVPLHSKKTLTWLFLSKASAFPFGSLHHRPRTEA